MSDVNFTIAFNSNGDVVLKNITNAVNETKGAFAGSAPSFEVPANAIEALRRRGLGARQALGMLASTVGGMGEAGHIAASGLITATAGVGIIGIGVATAATAVALLVEHFHAAKDAAEHFRQAVRTGDLGFFATEIDKSDQKLVSLTADLDALRRGQAGGDDFWNRFTLSADRAATKQRQIGETEAEKAKAVAAQQGILAKSFQETGLQIEFQTAAIGQNSAEQERLAGDLRLVTAFQRGLKDASRETKDAFIAINDANMSGKIGESNHGLQQQIDLLKAADDPLKQIEIEINALKRGAGPEETARLDFLKRLKDDAKNAADGMPILTKALADVGVSATMPKTQLDAFATAEFELERKFQSGAMSAREYSKALEEVGRSAASPQEKPFVDAIASFKTQMDDLARGPTAQVFDVWSGKMITLSGGFEAMDAGLKKFKEDLRTAFGDEIPASLQGAFSKVESSFKQISDEKLYIKADGSQAISEAERVKNELNSIHDKIVSINVAGPGALGNNSFSFDPATGFRALQGNYQAGNIMLDVMASGSPTMSFSDYFKSYAPGVVSNFANTASSNNINMGTNLSLAGDLMKRYLDDKWYQQWTIGLGGAWTATSDPVAMEISTLQSLLFGSGGKGGLMSASTPGGGNGGGGGGGSVINIDLSHASLSADFLDKELIPRLESLLARTTGQSPTTRVLN
jgi:hypothetical protein